MKFKILVLFLIFSLSAFAQKKNELGFFAGTSYYLGDINPSVQFYSPSFAVGGLYRLSFNPRQVLRVNLFYGSLKGSGRVFSNPYQQFRNISFSASLLEASVLFEFNFLSVAFQPRKRIVSPYIFSGLAYEILLGSTYNIGNDFTVPLGTGIKYVANEKITMGLEWGFRKTFKDGLDGVLNPGPETYHSSINNMDWYSFAGFFITFRLFDKTGNCPVYQKK